MLPHRTVTANLDAIEELETALKHTPDYIALGPIFPTTLKSMRFAPQGIPKITRSCGAR